LVKEKLSQPIKEYKGDMLVVGQEVIIDLTDEDHGSTKSVVAKAHEALNDTTQEITIVYHLDIPFPVKELLKMLLSTPNLYSFSMFSIALDGTSEDFEDFAAAFRQHKTLKEVHMVDCGMYGAWRGSTTNGSTASSATWDTHDSFGTKGATDKAETTTMMAPSALENAPDATAKMTAASRNDTPTVSVAGNASGTLATIGKMPVVSGSALAVSVADTRATISTVGPDISSAKDKAKKTRDAACGSITTGASSRASSSIPSRNTRHVNKKARLNADGSTGVSSDKKPQCMTSICSSAPRTMDVLLEALGSLQSLENIELYGIPSLMFDGSKDAANESQHRAVLREGENDDDIPMVPMAADDDTTFSDDDFMDDYDEDIRGIPGNKKAGKTDRKLSLLMSPAAIGALCRGPSLNNVGLEDLNLKDAHIIRMMQSLAMPSNTIKELKIWGCNITDKACSAIAQMLQVNKTLERLDLANNHIDDEGCVLIANALHGNTALVSLNLAGNECAQNYDAVSVGGAYEAFLKLLEKNKTLTDLVLEPYEQDDEADVPEFIFIPNDRNIADDVGSSASDSADGF